MIRAKKTKDRITLEMGRKDYDLLTYVIGEYSDLALESDCDSERYRDLYCRIIEKVNLAATRPDGNRRLE